jgi:hypothetical protein
LVIAQHMSTERLLPEPRRSRAAMVGFGVGVFSGVCAIWAGRADSLVRLCFLVVGLVAVLVAFYYRRRCSQCACRMVFRAEPLRPETYRYRILFDCEQCDVVWDSGEVQEENLG